MKKILSLGLILSAVLFTAFSLQSIADSDNMEKKERLAKVRKNVDQGLKKLDEEIGDLELKIKNAGTSAKTSWKKTLLKLKKDRNHLRQEIDQGWEKSKDKAEDISDRISRAFKELSKGVKKAKEEITD